MVAESFLSCDTSKDREKTNQEVDGFDEQSDEEHLAMANKCKERGNNAFKKGHPLSKHTAGKDLLSDACFQYAMGLKHIDAIKKDTLQDKKIECNIALLLNLAAVGIKVETFSQVIECCNKVLELDSASAKAYYRLSLAMIGEGKLNEADDLLQKACKILPNDSSIKALSNSNAQAIAKKIQQKNFREETEKGKKVQQRKQAMQEENTKKHQIKFEIKDLTTNGGKTEKFLWSQTLTDVNIAVFDERMQHRKNILCKFSRRHLKLFIIDETGKILHCVVNGKLFSEVVVDECCWMLENKGELHVSLRKEDKPGGKAEDCWWSQVSEEDPKIDTKKILLQKGVHDLPIDSRKNALDELMKLKYQNPDEYNDVMRQRHQLQQDFQEREYVEKDAIEKNPRKKEIASMLRSSFPDIDVVIR